MLGHFLCNLFWGQIKVAAPTVRHPSKGLSQTDIPGGNTVVPRSIRIGLVSCVVLGLVWRGDQNLIEKKKSFETLKNASILSKIMHKIGAYHAITIYLVTVVFQKLCTL